MKPIHTIAQVTGQRLWVMVMMGQRRTRTKNHHQTSADVAVVRVVLAIRGKGVLRLCLAKLRFVCTYLTCNRQVCLANIKKSFL